MRESVRGKVSIQLTAHDNYLLYIQAIYKLAEKSLMEF